MPKPDHFATPSSAFSEFVDQNNYDEISSYGGSTSCSDTEPELQDFESDVFSTRESDEDDAGDGNQTISGRAWTRAAPTADEQRPRSTPRVCALTARSEDIASIEECFQLFINDEIIDAVIACTNKRAEAAYSKESQKKWKPVDRVEIKAFLGVLLLIGRFRESRESTDHLWRRNTAFSRQIYAAAMSRDRFKEIFKFIRFDDVATKAERKAEDKLAPLRAITNIFAANCRECYEASNVGTVDEQLVTFKGRCPFKVYMPREPGKYGMKLCTLCDAKTYYCCNFDVYLGRRGNTIQKAEEEHVVKKLTSFWDQSERVVTTNNCFTDITLAEDLLRDHIFLVGTMRRNRKHLPRSIISAQLRERFTSEFLSTNELTLVSYIPKPRKCVIALSSLHRRYDICGLEDNYRPEIISYYNSTKDSVSTLDKLLKEYSCRRSTKHWPLSLFLNYVDVAAYNAFVIWLVKNPTWECSSSMKKKRKMFLEKLGDEMCSENIDRRASEFESRSLVLQKHIARAIESTGRRLKRKKITIEFRKRSRCYICIGNDNKYSSRCDECLQNICNSHVIIQKQTVCTNCIELE